MDNKILEALDQANKIYLEAGIAYVAAVKELENAEEEFQKAYDKEI